MNCKYDCAECDPNDVNCPMNTNKMKEFTNNGVSVTKATGCWNCKNLSYYEKDSYESIGDNGWGCEANENSENFKDFPCKRKLKCFEVKDEKD